MAMKRAIRDPHQLLRILKLEGRVNLSKSANFPTFVPLEFVSRMTIGDPSDPLLRQVLPLSEEDEEVAGFTSDPVGDLNATACDSLLHKYDGRALLISTSACGIHCRYCFRREFPYQDVANRSHRWQPALEYLRTHSEIDEVLLSGGDPLTLTDDSLFDLLRRIDEIGHIRRIRIHTRMPIVIPQRVTPQLINTLRDLQATVWMVVHCNHTAEIDTAVLDSWNRCVDNGIPVLNQSVLLRGVNDSVEQLESLCRTLVNFRVQPYYLHSLDRVRGAAHFEVSNQKGLELMKELRARLPGYAVPTFVQETAGQSSKSVVTSMDVPPGEKA
ncbi:MAG: EF-P beta-lysylation protein EpmB [Planctomycetota bacterium]